MLKQDDAGPAHSMFWRGDAYPYFPWFRLLERSSVLWFHGPTMVVRSGREFPAPEAAPPLTGDEWNCKPLELTAIAQMRDQDSIAACDEHGMAMVVTGVRHFRH
jgi:hypothetical protein